MFCRILRMGHVFEDWQIKAYINMVRAKKNYLVSGLLFLNAIQSRLSTKPYLSM